MQCKSCTVGHGRTVAGYTLHLMAHTLTYYVSNVLKISEFYANIV